MLIFAYYLKRHSVRMRLGPMPIKMFHFTTHLSAFNSIPQSNQMPNWHYLRLPWCGYYRIWVYPLVCILKLLQLKFTAIYLWFSLSLLKSIFESTWVNLSLPIFNMAKLESTFESTWIFLSLLYCNLPLCQLELTTWVYLYSIWLNLSNKLNLPPCQLELTWVYLWSQQCHWSRLWHSQSFQRPPDDYFDNESFGKMMIITVKIIWK